MAIWTKQFEPEMEESNSSAALDAGSSLDAPSTLAPVTPQGSSITLEKRVTVRRMLPKPKARGAPKYTPKLEVFPPIYEDNALLPKEKETRDDDEIM